MATKLTVVPVEFKVKPFTVPNFVLAEPPEKRNERGFPDGPGDDHLSLPLHALSVEALESLCADFRAGVFEKAGKKPLQLSTVKILPR